MDLLKSKKFQAAIGGIIVVIGQDLAGLNLDPETVTAIIGLVVSYIVGQGIADHGKEKAKVEAQNGK